MLTEKIWEIKKPTKEVVNKLVTELDLSTIIAKVLVNRGYDNPKQVQEFLDCRLSKMHDPYLFNGMEKVVNRILSAIETGEQIIIYGDYDVDGITSSSLLLNYLKDCGAAVDYYIPNRLKEGYGLNKQAVKNLADLDTDLIITVDCGIKAYQAIELANSLGIEVIVTDHHTAPQNLPTALEVINPKRHDSTYPFAELAGVAVAFKVVQALELARTDAKMPTAIKYLALVTLGVVADIVPLRDENRIIVKKGLKQLNQLTKDQPSLFSLAEVTGCLDKEISTGHIAFGLGPRINACGRLGEPELGVELLTNDNYQQAFQIAQKMDKLNDHRQQLSQEMQEDAEARIEQLDLQEEWVLVLASSNWHSGVIGNVASDINEKYNRPVILMAIEEEGVAKGSARSISNFNIHDALADTEDLLLSFGGHKQAAGLSIEQEKISQFKEKINQYAKKELEEKDLIPKQKVDAAVELEELSCSLVGELNALAPFGCANPSPKLITKGVEISNYKLVGSNNDHLKFTAQNSKNKIGGIAFNQQDAKSKLDIQAKDVSLLFNVEINCWRGNKNLQLKVRDFKIPLKSEIDQLFAKRLATLTNENMEEEYFIELEDVNKLVLNNEHLTEGQQVELILEENNLKESAIKVVDQLGNEIGYLPIGLAKQLARKIDLGINYSAVISSLAINENNRTLVELLIKKDKSEAYYKKLIEANNYKNKLKSLEPIEALQKIQEKLFGETSEGIIIESIKSLLQEKSTLSVLNPAQNKDILLLSFAAWNAITTKKMSVLLYPYKSILEERYPIISDKLSSLGIKSCQASSSLTDSQEVELKQQLEQNECNLLVATPQVLTSDLVNLENIEVGFVAVDGCSYLAKESNFKFLKEAITSFDNPLLLGVASAVKHQKVEQLLREFDFDNKLISNYNKFSLQVIDKRSLSNKNIYLNQLITKEEQTLIYVNSKQKSIELSAELRKKKPNLNGGIIFYHQGMTKKQQKLVEERFKQEEIKIVVATAAFNEVLNIKNIDQVIFYQSRFNSYNFKYLANQAVKSMSGKLYLLYQIEDLKDNKKLLKQMIPNRKLLKELYLLLSKNKNKAGKITINQQELLSKLNSLLTFSINKRILVDSLNIFEELNLVQRTKGKGGIIKLLAKPEQKLDLFTSIRYNEYVELEKAFTYLETLAAKEKHQILKFITETYLTTLKGEKDIELSR